MELSEDTDARKHPRSAEALVAALASVDSLLRDHFATVGRRPGVSEASRKEAAALHATLAHALAERAEQQKFHASTPSNAMVARARIEALLGVVRKAALVTFGVARPDLYRKVTSQYRRDARRACRTRAKSEPPPRKSSVVGAVVGRRKRGAR